MLPHTGLEMVIVTMKTTPPSKYFFVNFFLSNYIFFYKNLGVDLMEEIVVIMKWRATPTTVMFANAWNTQVNK